MRLPRAVHLVVTLLVAGACGGEAATDPDTKHLPPFRVVASSIASDTVDGRLPQALVVELRDSSGRPAIGKAVRFEVVPRVDPNRGLEIPLFVQPLTSQVHNLFVNDVTDSLGQAKTIVIFGAYAGTATLLVRTPELARVDTVRFTVLPGNPTQFIVGPRDTTVLASATYALRVTAVDRHQNPVANTPITLTASAGITVSATGQVSLGNFIGRGFVAMRINALTDTARVIALPKWPLVAAAVDANGDLDIVTLNTDGSAFTKIAATGERSVSPTMVAASPNIVYYTGDPARNARLWIVTRTSAPRVLFAPTTTILAAAWPRLSADGAWVYFTARTLAGYSLWRIRPDASQLDSIATISTPDVNTAAALSPDGTTAAIDDLDGIKFITLSTKTTRVVANVRCAMPRYSPDGARLACLNDGAMGVMNADGTGYRTLSPRERYDPRSGIDWSPDGNFLLAKAPVRPVLISLADGTDIPLPPAVVDQLRQAAVVR
jgi:hypothetical protein